MRASSLWRAARTELDPARRAALFMRMNDLVVASGAVIPIVQRARVEAVSRDLQFEISPWFSPLWSLAPGTAGRVGLGRRTSPTTRRSGSA